MPGLRRRSALLQGGFPVRMRSQARHLVVPFLYRPMAWERSIHIDEGTAHQLYLYDFLQNIADQVRYVLTSGAYVPRVADGSTVCHRLRKIPITDTWKMLFLLLHIYVGGAMLFNHLKCNEVVWTGTQVSIFLKAVFDVSPGIQEARWISVVLHKLPGKENITTSVDLPEATTSARASSFLAR